MLEAPGGCQPKEAGRTPGGRFAECPGHRAQAESTFVLSQPCEPFSGSILPCRQRILFWSFSWNKTSRSLGY